MSRDSASRIAARWAPRSRTAAARSCRTGCIDRVLVDTTTRDHHFVTDPRDAVQLLRTEIEFGKCRATVAAADGRRRLDRMLVEDGREGGAMAALPSHFS
ncbi:hypothetical protein ACFVUN_23090 [Kitasatospora griseola]|uniref:hypothetical protein n=1 Tax=Kitasatospora griseola TaxID=2064 RepID=UPI0036DD7C32